jgi:hypothetical protein
LQIITPEATEVFNTSVSIVRLRFLQAGRQNWDG